MLMWEVFRPADQHSLVCILLTYYPNRPTTILKSGNMHLAWDLMQNPACHNCFTKRLMQSKNECGFWRNASPWDDVLTWQVTQKSRRRLKLSYIMPIKCKKVASECNSDSTLNHPNTYILMYLVPLHPGNTTSCHFPHSLTLRLALHPGSQL